MTGKQRTSTSERQRLGVRQQESPCQTVPVVIKFALFTTVSAFVVTALEVLTAGLPTLTNSRVETRTLVGGFHLQFAIAAESKELAEKLDWCFNLD